MRLISVETIKLGLNNLRLHKLRSFLTSLGIIFGVAAVICMLSISQASSADQLRMIELLGTKNIIIRSTKPPQDAESSARDTQLVTFGITDEDVRRISSSVPHVAQIVPLKTVSYRATHQEYQGAFETTGVTSAFFHAVNVSVSHGRPLTDVDIDTRTNVCVIGQQVRETLFPMKDPLGEEILVERAPSAVPFTVVGVLDHVKTAGAPQRGVEQRDLNAEIFVPFDTAYAQFGEIAVKLGAGSREFIKVQYSGLYITADDVDMVEPVSRMVKQIMEHGHEKEDYEVTVPLAQLLTAQRIKRNNQLVLGFIASISLLVGGIGIMNIMLATVTERTREIGIRRALGAKQRHITVQFLVETVVLSTGGGLVGVVLGVVGAQIITWLADWVAIISPWSIIVSFSLSVAVGIGFGMYPAMTAAQLNPIDALRRE